MKKIIKLLTVGLASVALLSGCGSEPEPTPTPEPTPVDPVEVKVESVKLDKNSLDLFLTKSAYLKATISPENASNKLLKWESSNEDVVIVSAAGKVTGLGVGTAKVKVSSAADPTKFDECSVNVTVEDTTVHVTDVKLDKEETNLYVGKNLQLNATVLPENATEKGVTWSSNNEAVAIVTSSGKVAGIGEGDAVITVASKEKPEIKATCLVHVSIEDTDIHVTSVYISQEAIQFDLAGTTQFSPTVTVLPENATNKALSWTSSDPSKVMVDSTSGKMVAIAVTSEPVIVTAKSVDRPELSDSISVTVVNTTDPTIHVTDVELPSEITVDLKGGASEIVTATITPSNAGNKKVNWELAEAGTAEITPVGDTSVSIKGLNVGEVDLTATSEDNPGASAVCKIKVVDTAVHVTAVDITGEHVVEGKLDVTLGGFEQVTAGVLPANADNKGIVWSMAEADKQYVTLSSESGASQTIRGIKATEVGQVVVITAKSAEDNTIVDTLEVTVTDPTIHATGVSVKTSDAEVSGPLNIEYGKNVLLTASVLPADATYQDIVWEPQGNATEFVTLSSTVSKAITVTGKKLTNSTPVTLRAKSKDEPTFYKDVVINVIDPTDVNVFVDFVEPVDYANYLARTDAASLNEVEGIDTNASLAKGNFYKYEAGQEAKANYKVGDQGFFKFAPSAYVKLAGQESQTLITNVSTTKSLKKYNSENSTYEEVTLSDYVEIYNDAATPAVDPNGSNYKFKAAAVGSQFKLELLPDSSKYYSKDPEPFEFCFDVIEGYNVDSLAELTLFDNMQTEWSGYKTENGLSGVEASGGIVLHKDIAVTSDILPASHKYDEAFVDSYIAANKGDFENWAHDCFGNDQDKARAAFIDSPKDYVSIFDRSTYEDGEFVLEGNFFNIDARNFKKVALLDPGSCGGGVYTLMGGLGGDGSHTNFFAINENATGHGKSFPTVARDVTMRNFSLIGNSGLDNNLASKGGIIGIKLDSAHFIVENAIISKTFASFLTQDFHSGRATATITSLDVDRMTSYDSYSSMFYVYGTQNNNIQNSWMSTCGGPLVILDEPLADLPQSQWAAYKANMSCTNCYMHNYVSGTEPWFQGHEGSVRLIDEYIIQPGLEGGWYSSVAAALSGRTIGKKYSDEYKVCDFICIDIMASNFAGNILYNLGGGLSIDNGTNKAVNMSMAKVDKGDPSTTGGVVPLFPTQPAPFLFQGAEDSLGVFDGTQLLPAAGNIFADEYLAAYLNPAIAGANPEDPAAMAAALQYGRFIGVVLGTFAM